MKGFPKSINTKQDFENLLSMNEYREQAKTKLKRIKNIDDSMTTKATTLVDENDPESEWNTIEVSNPNPVWKRLQFKSREETTDLITEVVLNDNKKNK